MQTVEYEYKDANRRWWRAQGTRFNNRRNANFECRWDCQVFLLDDKGNLDALVWEGQLFINEQLTPLSAEIMAAYLAEAATLATQMAYHCR